MTVKNTTIKRQRFEKIASRRVQKILEDIDSLSKCSNKNSYSFEEKDVKKMLSVIKEKVKQLEATFMNNKITNETKFKF